MGQRGVAAPTAVLDAGAPYSMDSGSRKPSDRAQGTGHRAGRESGRHGASRTTGAGADDERWGRPLAHAGGMGRNRAIGHDGVIGLTP